MKANKVWLLIYWRKKKSDIQFTIKFTINNTDKEQFWSKH